VPHIAVVIEVVPHGVHPVTVGSFMTSPDDGLVMGQRRLSPAAWLASGGDARRRCAAELNYTFA
jgi:hypothetical protein